MHCLTNVYVDQLAHKKDSVIQRMGLSEIDSGFGGGKTV